jgi:hypothetical protein
MFGIDRRWKGRRPRKYGGRCVGFLYGPCHRSREPAWRRIRDGSAFRCSSAGVLRCPPRASSSLSITLQLIFAANDFNDEVTILVVKCDFHGYPTLTHSSCQREIPSESGCRRLVRSNTYYRLDIACDTETSVSMLTGFQSAGPLADHGWV